MVVAVVTPSLVGNEPDNHKRKQQAQPEHVHRAADYVGYQRLSAFHAGPLLANHPCHRNIFCGDVGFYVIATVAGFN